MSDSSVPEDDMTADDVKAPTTDDGETPEPAKDQRRYAFLSRHISMLRALRLSGILTIIFAIALYVFLGGSNNAFWPPKGLLLGLFLGILPIFIIWAWSRQINAWRRLIALFFALCSVMSAGFLVHWWWKLYDQTSFKSIFLLSLGLASLGLGLLITTDLLLRGVRNHAGITPGNTEDPARFAPYRPGADSATTGKRILRGTLRFVLILAPTTAVIVANTVANPVTQITAPFPEGPLPDRSTGIRTTLSWTRDVTELLATASGAAGPVILTPEGLTGLNPTDGTTLWTYQRTNATYAKMLGVESGQGSFGNLSGSYLVSSPNGRYVALRIMLPYELAQFHTNDAATVVVDTLTGHATSEHLSSSRRHLQLTDSAILDGTTAYNLDDGKVRWSLKPLTDNSRLYPASGYSGPAGHRSFILSGKFNEDRPEHRSKSLTLMSDADPANTTTVENIAIDILTGYPVIVGGRTAQYTKALVVEREKGEDSRAVQAQETRVVTLDSLAGLEEIKPIDMGKTIGLNGAASHASGTLAAYPIPEDGKIKFRYSGKSVEHLEWGKPTVGTVFDPTTNTTTPANQYPGLAAATVGIAPAAQGDTLSAEIVMKPGDGSTGASIPLDLRTMLLFPLEELKLSTPSLLPSQLPRHIGGEAVNFFNTPESTLVTLKIDDKKLLDSLDWYSLYSPPTGTGYEYAPSYRLYGLTGDAS